MKKNILLFLILTFYSFYSFAEYDVKWTNVSGCTYTPLSNTLIKSGNNWGNCVAISANKLKPEEDGYVSYNVGNLPSDNKYRFFGLSNYNTTGTYGSIKYAFYIFNNNLYVSESGSITGLGSNQQLQLNDNLIVQRAGATVYYKRVRNGVTTTVHTTISGVNPNEELRADAWAYHDGATLNNLKSSFGYIDCDASLTHIDSENNILSGAINISNISGTVNSHTLSWSTGSTSNNVSNLQAEEYILTITDGLGGVEERKFKIGYLTKWTNVSGYTYTSSMNSISKASGANNWNDGIAISANKLLTNQEGSVKYSVENITDSKIRLFGLSTYNLASGFPTVKYAIETYNNDVFIVEGGNFNHTQSDILQVGDELEIERIGTTILYNRIRNGKKWPFYETTTLVNINEELYADLNFYSSVTTLNNVITSFNILQGSTSFLLQEKLNGGYYEFNGDLLAFDYEEQYHIEGTKYLSYKLYNDQYILQAESTESGSTITLPSSPIQTIEYGFNTCALDLSGLGLSHGIYTLEVSTAKKDKLYLKFKY